MKRGEAKALTTWMANREERVVSERVKVYLQPWCGSSPCPDDDDPKSGALLVHRITIDGGEVPFTKARIKADARDVLTLEIELVPGHLEVLTKVDPYEDVRQK